MTDAAPKRAYELAAQLADHVAIDNACLALVTVFPETSGRVDVYVPDFVKQRGFEAPGHSADIDQFWTDIASGLLRSSGSRQPLVVVWRNQTLHISAAWLSGNRWVLTWQPAEAPDPSLASLVPVASNDAVVRVDDEGILVEANQSYFKLGWGQPESVGKPLADTVPHGYAGELRGLLATVSQDNATVQRIIVTRRHPPRWLHVRAHPIMLMSGQQGVEINISDVTGGNMPKPEALAKLMRDHLTGALNRRAFFNIIESDEVSPTSFDTVIFIDVQGFKSINDTWGHTVGDQTLVEVARGLQHACGPGDIFARLGGDEFVILAMPGSPVETTIREWNIQSIIAGGNRIPVSLRAGIARRDVGQNLSELVPQADHAVTAAKHDASIKVQEWNPEISRSVARRSSTDRAVRQAIDDDQILAHFQPLVNLDRGEVVGFEALLRVNGDDGSLPPVVVLETARRIGLSDILARRIALSAFTEGKALLELFPQALLEVNLSREYLASGTAIDAMVSIAQSCNIPFDRISFELTEELAEGIPPPVLRRQVERAQNLGIGLMIDDFGRGETSLSLLRDLRPSGIKLDRSLVPSENDHDGWRFVEGAVAMLSTLTDNLIVEGIEQPCQSRRMHDLGIATQQGWLFGRAERAEHWLTTPIAADRPL